MEELLNAIEELIDAKVDYYTASNEIGEDGHHCSGNKEYNRIIEAKESLGKELKKLYDKNR